MALGGRRQTVTRRASPEEFAEWAHRLRRWQDPVTFAAAVDALEAEIGTHAISQTGSPFRDAWVAARCALLANPAKVRLGEDPPDFELMFGSTVTPFEMVEVMDPRRRRGDELAVERRQEEAGIAPTPEPLEHVPTEIALGSMRARSAAKALNRYARGTVLAVYLNVGFVEDEDEFCAGWRSALAASLATFEEVWVLDQDRIHRLRRDPA